MTTYQEIIRTFNSVITKINTHLYTLNQNERLQVWGMTDDNILPTIVNVITISNVRNCALHLDMDPTSHNYLTVKDFDLTIRQTVNGGDDILASKHLATESDELYQSILARTPKKTITSSEILRYWETLRERLNEAAYCHNLEDVTSPEDYDAIPDVKNTITLPVDDHFKIILEYHHGHRGLVFTSCKVDFHNFNTSLTRADGYLLAVEPMLKFIALVESNRDKESVEDSLQRYFNVAMITYWKKLRTDN